MYAKNEPTNSNVHPKLLLMEVMPSQKPYPSQHGQQLQHLFLTRVSERWRGRRWGGSRGRGGNSGRKVLNGIISVLSHNLLESMIRLDWTKINKTKANLDMIPSSTRAGQRTRARR